MKVENGNCGLLSIGEHESYGCEGCPPESNQVAKNEEIVRLPIDG